MQQDTGSHPAPMKLLGPAPLIDSAAGLRHPSAPAQAPPQHAVLQRDDVAVLLLVELAAGSRAWGWSRIVLGQRPLRGVSGLRFAKALGSGERGGFGLRPSLSRQGLFALFDGERAAQAFLASPQVAAYRAHAKELCTVLLRATSSRGRWSGHDIGVSAVLPEGACVAALTRASIRPLKAQRFWRRSPLTESALEGADGCRLAMGLGEAPLLRQATFSLWRDQAAMDAYARSGAHMQAIVAAQREGWFSESMFVRFVPLRIQGEWKGQHFG